MASDNTLECETPPLRQEVGDGCVLIAKHMMAGWTDIVWAGQRSLATARTAALNKANAFGEVGGCLLDSGMHGARARAKGAPHTADPARHPGSRSSPGLPRHRWLPIDVSNQHAD